jgi:hypothetical protein
MMGKKSVICYSLIFIMIFQVSAFSFLSSSSNKQPVFALYSESSDANLSARLPIFQKGLSYSAWSGNAFSSSESDESLRLLTETNTEWIAICFSWAQSNTTSYDIQLDPNRTPTTESVRHAIEVAHGLGLKVMLKPMVDTLEEEKIQGYPTVWRGEIQPSDNWFASYSEFINGFAEFAEQNNVELFCVGCEFKSTVMEKEQWEMVISGVREHYSGPITYAADWTSYQDIDWWDSVDYVGIDAYFPLSIFNYNPSLEKLTNAWNDYANEIEEWLSMVNMPVIFTEIGYRSGDGTNMAPSNYWLEMSLDLQEQTDCYEAAFQVLWKRSWFYGFYWWTWIYDPAQGGLNDSYHTPQNKPTQELITQWYSQTRQVAVIDRTFKTTEKCFVNQIQSVGFHVSWEQDGSDITNGILKINGTDYVTNSTGWVSLSASYDTVGKRSWVVTDFQHPNANGYLVAIEVPSIVWDNTDVDIEVVSESFGVSKVIVKLVQEYDGTAVTGASTFVNGELCEEIEPGVYEMMINSWSPFQQITVQTNVAELEGETFTTTEFNIMNMILYLILVAALIVLLAVLLKRRSKVKNQ